MKLLPKNIGLQLPILFLYALLASILTIIYYTEVVPNQSADSVWEQTGHSITAGIQCILYFVSAGIYWIFGLLSTLRIGRKPRNTGRSLSHG